MAYPVSPYQQVGGLYYFPRMISKIRLHARGELPADYVPMLEKGYNLWLCDLLGVRYPDLAQTVLENELSDEEALEWCYTQRGGPLNASQIKIWNGFAAGRGRKDDRSESLQKELRALNLADRGIETNFDLFVAEEGHPRPTA
ncbi:MAG: DUF5069 domain-containing protein [Verrucomicrobiota bacterium JB022]|nr:DUF5069 domain-containing protein [Verrucomicrobiota bacterium JB022]